MTDRSRLHEQFVARFHSGRRRKPFSTSQLDSAEAALGMLWPSSYREFASTHGAVWTPGLLNLIVESHLEFSDVQDFLKPSQAVTGTRDWRDLGLAEDCFAFASDCSGSLFVFRGLPSAGPRPDDAPVWFFDHDHGVVEPVEVSFDAWLGRFLALESRV